MDGCYFCYDEDRKGLHRGALHETCENHAAVWGPKSKYSGTTKKTRLLRESIIRSYKARVKAGEDPIHVKKAIQRELNCKRERVDTALRLAGVK